MITSLSLTLAGCSTSPPTAQTTPPSSGTNGTSSATPSTPGSDATSGSTPAATSNSSTPITASCAEILDTGALQKTGSSFVSATNPVPSAGSPLSDIATIGGLTCTWTNTTTGATLVLGAAHLSSEQLAQAKTRAAASSSPTSIAGTSSGAAGFFFSSAGVGEAQLVTDKFWIVLQSRDFGNAQDSATLMSLAESALIWNASK